MNLYQYSPQQGGFDILKAAQTLRQVLYAGIDPRLSVEEKTKARSKIWMADYNELRALNCSITDSPAIAEAFDKVLEKALEIAHDNPNWKPEFKRVELEVVGPMREHLNERHERIFLVPVFTKEN